jgi:hypothetical protein
MAHIRPIVFVSYSTQDKHFIDELVTDLRAAQVDVWYDNWEIQPGESLQTRIFEEGIDRCDLFAIYLTKNSINSEWCRKELNKALTNHIEGNGVYLSIFVDSEDTLDSLPEEIKTYRIPTLSKAQYSRTLGQLISRAWEALQNTKRLINPRNNILCGTNIMESIYRRSEFVKKVNRSLIVAGPNLRGWLTEEESRLSLIHLIKKAPHIQITMILGTPESLKILNNGYGEGTEHLRASVRDLRWINSQLSSDEKQRFRVAFHFGAVTLSAVIRDPDGDDGVLLFTPRWGIDYQPLKRLYCVIEKKTNPEQFNAIYQSTFNLIQSDALTLDQADF